MLTGSLLLADVRRDPDCNAKAGLRPQFDDEPRHYVRSNLF